jgi:hypothetical protein
MSFLDDFIDSFYPILQQQVEIEVRKLQHHFDQQIVSEIPPPTHKEEGVHTMEVGKIVTQDGHHAINFSGTSVKEESLTVSMSGNQITLTANQDMTERERMYGIRPVHMTPEQALELGQVLLKAAEILPEYRDAINKITEERTKVEARYKDMISGLGLDSEVDVLDERGTFKVIEAG